MGKSWCRCVYTNCKNTTVNCSKSFFMFPKNDVSANSTRQNEWINACELTNPNITKNTKVCQDHFSDGSFSNFQRNRLFQNAIPCLFEKLQDDLGEGCSSWNCKSPTSTTVHETVSVNSGIDGVYPLDKGTSLYCSDSVSLIIDNDNPITVSTEYCG